MTEFEEFQKVIARLRAPDGCPWDREQSHESLKPACIEEAAEVLCGINILTETGNPDNLREELGDLLLQIVMHAQIAEEEGLFTMDDVIRGVREKMIRRHPHVFGEEKIGTSGAVLNRWEEIKKQEKAGKEWTEAYLPEAFREAAPSLDCPVCLESADPALLERALLLYSGRACTANEGGLSAACLERLSRRYGLALLPGGN